MRPYIKRTQKQMHQKNLYIPIDRRQRTQSSYNVSFTKCVCQTEFCSIIKSKHGIWVRVD